MVTGHNTSATACTAQLPCLQCLKCCFSLPGSPQNLPQRSFFTAQVVFALPFQIISSTMQRLQSLANINLSCQICQSFCLSSLLKNMAEENIFWPRTIKDRTSTPADPGKKQCKPWRLRWHRCFGHFSRLLQHCFLYQVYRGQLLCASWTHWSPHWLLFPSQLEF